MKPAFLILLMATAFIGCNRPLELTQENLQGNWYYCDDTTYIEIHIEGYQMIYVSNGMNMNFNYAINGDSIATYDMYSGAFNGLMMVQLNNNQLIQSWNDQSGVHHEHIAHGIEDQIMSYFDYNHGYKEGNVEENEQLLNSFKAGYFERKEKFSCDAK